MSSCCSFACHEQFRVQLLYFGLDKVDDIVILCECLNVRLGFNLPDVGVLENEAEESVGQLGSHHRLQVQLQSLQHVVGVLGEPVINSPEN